MTDAASPNAPASVIWALGLTQIIGYGTLYYSFGALAPSMARDFGWSEEWVFGALSGSLLIGGLIAPTAGAWADRFGAAKLMTWGSIGAALALAICAIAPEPFSFVAGLVGIEIASAFVLYATAFAALAQVATGGAQRSITYLTLIAGFASTIFWPITTSLHDHMSWREVYLVFAALNLAICLPAHIWLARHTARRSALGATTYAPVVPLVPDDRRRLALILMLIGFALQGFVSSAILVHMVPMLGTLGLGAAGVFVTTLFGPAQVLSRVVNMRYGRSLSQPALAVIGDAFMPIALIVLLASAPWLPGAATFAGLFGLGSGISSIVSGTLPLALFGSSGYGRNLGLISSARLVVSSFAPFVLSVIAAASVTLALWAVVAIGFAAAIAFASIWWWLFARPSAQAPAPAAAADSLFPAILLSRPSDASDTGICARARSGQLGVSPKSPVLTPREARAEVTMNTCDAQLPIHTTFRR